MERCTYAAALALVAVLEARQPPFYIYVYPNGNFVSITRPSQKQFFGKAGKTLDHAKKRPEVKSLAKRTKK